MPPIYKLTYFNFKALGEPARFLMKYGGIEFEDIRFEIPEWPEIKPNMPFGQVPILTVGTRVYNQSLAIARLLGRQVKLTGSDEWEDAEIDAIADTVNDFKMKIGVYFYEKDAAIKEARKQALLNEIIPYYLEKLDAVAGRNHGYLALSKLTWADMYFVGILDYLNFMTGMDLTAKHSNLQKVKDKVYALPAIQAWLEVRPETYM